MGFGRSIAALLANTIAAVISLTTFAAVSDQSVTLAWNGDGLSTMDIFSITAVRVAVSVSAGQLLLTGRGPVAYTYDLQTSRDLQHRTTIGHSISATNGTFRFTDPAARTNALGYYRLRQASP